MQSLQRRTHAKWRVAAGILSVFGSVVLPLTVTAQDPVELPNRGSIAGTVIDDKGLPVKNAEVLLEQFRVWQRTSAGGRFTFQGLKKGRYNLSVRSLGYKESSVRVNVNDSTARVEITLQRAPFSLPATVTTASRGGLSGVVADTGFRPLADVKVQVMGFAGIAQTDSAGKFFLPVTSGKYLVRLDHDGFARQLIGVSIPENEGREIAAWMIPQKGRSNPQVGANLFDMNQRILRMGPASGGLYTREDIEKLGYRDLLTMVRNDAGYPIGGDCMALIDGGPLRRPIWRMSTADVEFVEVHGVAKPRVKSGPESGSRANMADQRVDQATRQNGNCGANIYLWLRH